MADEYVLDGKKYTLIPDGTKTVETALYRINIPEKWAGNVHYHVSEDNSIIFRGYTNISAPIDSELISITPVTSVDEAWKMVDELPGCCIFSKDYVYVFRLPETAPQQSYKKDDLRLGIDEISSFAEGLEILKDGGSGAAINSIRAENLERILAPEKNNKVSDMHERHYDITLRREDGTELELMKKGTANIHLGYFGHVSSDKSRYTAWLEFGGVIKQNEDLTLIVDGVEYK